MGNWFELTQDFMRTDLFFLGTEEKVCEMYFIHITPGLFWEAESYALSTVVIDSVTLSFTYDKVTSPGRWLKGEVLVMGPLCPSGNEWQASWFSST